MGLNEEMAARVPRRSLGRNVGDRVNFECRDWVFIGEGDRGVNLQLDSGEMRVVPLMKYLEGMKPIEVNEQIGAVDGGMTAAPLFKSPDVDAVRPGVVEWQRADIHGQVEEAL